MRISNIFIFQIIVACFCQFSPATCFAWPANVLSIHDGDTLTVAPVGDESTPISIRLYGIDAPELSQPGGKEASEFLRKLLPSRTSVEVITMTSDRYGRVVALIAHNGKVINGMMISSGNAWVFSRYCAARFCREWRRMEDEAKASGLGIWKEGSPLPPWKFRKDKNKY